MLANTFTDTHFDNPDRRGRLFTFMARARADWGLDATAIACDEYTAVCIDDDGLARVFGEAPQYEDNATSRGCTARWTTRHLSCVRLASP